MFTLIAVQYTLQKTPGFVHGTLYSTSIPNNHNIFSKLMKIVILWYNPKLNKHRSNKPNFPQPTSASVLIRLPNVLKNQAFQNVS